MKERPILFSAPMVKALLRTENPKTQTRRGLKHDPKFGLISPSTVAGQAWQVLGNGIETVRQHLCPYGLPGDHLWVRESGSIALDKSAWMYSDASGVLGPIAPPDSDSWAREWKSCPSIHMPRWASRIDLRVIDVRVERLLDISGADAIAEGIERERRVVDVKCYGGLVHEIYGDLYFFEGGLEEGYEDELTAYFALWDKINGAGAHETNPWVWVVEFERVR